MDKIREQVHSLWSQRIDSGHKTQSRCLWETVNILPLRGGCEDRMRIQEQESMGQEWAAGLGFPIWFPCCCENHAANYSFPELFSTTPFPGSHKLGMAQKSAFCPVMFPKGSSKETDSGEFEHDSYFSLEIPKGLGIICCLQSQLNFSLHWGSYGLSSFVFGYKEKGSISFQYEDGFVTQHKRDVSSKGRPAHEPMASMAFWSSRGRVYLTISFLHL